MNSIDVGYRLKELSTEVKTLAAELKRLNENVGTNELWDNADMIQNWKVSPRTLATWRSEGLIGYVQVGSKIWYPQQAREEFLVKNLKRGGMLR